MRQTERETDRQRQRQRERESDSSRRRRSCCCRAGHTDTASRDDWPLSTCRDTDRRWPPSSQSHADRRRHRHTGHAGLVRQTADIPRTAPGLAAVAMSTPPADMLAASQSPRTWHSSYTQYTRTVACSAHLTPSHSPTFRTTLPNYHGSWPIRMICSTVSIHKSNFSFCQERPTGGLKM